MQAVGPAAARLHASGKFIDDHDGTVIDHVVLVAFVDRFGAYRRFEMVDKFDARVGIDIADTKRALGLFDARIAQHDLAVLIIGRVVLILDEGIGDCCEALVERFGVRYRCRNDERRARLIDEDRIDLVDDREVVPARLRQTLAQEAGRIFEIVAQIIKTEFIVGTVRDVGRVGLAARAGTQKVLFYLEASDLVHRLIFFFSQFCRDLRRIV